ncbi:KdsC family phosphatase [Belliella kenyensis]|uniref:3-deoxy-D-manno-octulosonate 8-phosphate phosphatase KdsC n=1 Tax=Belliella kenyensis TaxID=1472724 RepID=A0ABV8EK00_9BACT|nr:HAD-IIIA family hydrolase [Belliella kenyensis]MCH7403102.1 HAD-IIIA family hydrolase [Belliella kenyensis]MDN3602271.1 HAD-IIIA family hydrolase [Belliella kenyensis]
MENYLSGLTEIVKSKAQKIRLIITDVDGVLTDGGIIYDDNRLEYKKFNVKDGLIVGHLRRNGVLIGAITGRKSKVVEDRCEELKFDFHYHGIKDKGKKLEEILETLELDPEEVAYIGDDLIDLPILCRVGLSACPADALPYIQQKVDFISSRKGGEGVFRELGDAILIAKGLMDEIIENLLK